MPYLISFLGFAFAGVCIHGCAFWIANRVQSGDLSLMGHVFQSPYLYIAAVTALMSVVQIFFLANLSWNLTFQAGANKWWPELPLLPVIISFAGYAFAALLVAFIARQHRPTLGEILGLGLCLLGAALPQLIKLK